MGAGYGELCGGSLVCASEVGAFESTVALDRNSFVSDLPG